VRRVTDTVDASVDLLDHRFNRHLLRTEQTSSTTTRARGSHRAGQPTHCPRYEIRKLGWSSVLIHGEQALGCMLSPSAAWLFGRTVWAMGHISMRPTAFVSSRLLARLGKIR
jgi:hypothetical protein